MLRSPSLLSLIIWLKRQPPSTTYLYADLWGCLFARFLRGAGFSPKYVGCKHYIAQDGESYPFPPYFVSIAIGGTCTYADAFERALVLGGEFCGVDNETR